MKTSWSGILLALCGTALAAEIVQVVEDWPDQGPKVRGTLVDGRRDGTWREWYENGRLRNLTGYKAGKFHGVRREWHENGQVALDWTYTDGRPDRGVVKYWHANGSLKTSVTCGGQRKHPDQTQTFWHDNGTKEAEGRWRDEQMHGKWTYWYRSGKRQRVAHYRKGQYDGWVTEWDEEGEVVSRKRFENGKEVDR